MNWEQLDWSALDRLRAGFLSGSAADGPYWQSASDLAAYDLTYAERIGWKWDALLRELTLRQWKPPAGTTLIDWGCGSGIAGRRVLAAFGPAHFKDLHVWDHSEHARTFAATKARETFPSLPVSTLSSDPSSQLPAHSSQLAPYTLVLSHVFNELSADQRTALLSLVSGAQAVLWIEPGTHADSRTLAAVRDQFRNGPHHIVAPCTHRETCPLFQAANERDWCHFFAPAPPGIQNDSNWVRWSHRAGLDLRSQAYSCLVLELPAPSSQLPAHSARVLGRPEVFKPYARFLACDATGLHWLELSKRTDPALIKRLDKNPPVPLYALTHDGRQATSMTPLVSEQLEAPSS
ncbi:MAG: small ribosomal subunit Rsm22 family protein [Rariglobus sp.]